MLQERKVCRATTDEWVNLNHAFRADDPGRKYKSCEIGCARSHKYLTRPCFLVSLELILELQNELLIMSVEDLRRPSLARIPRLKEHNLSREVPNFGALGAEYSDYCEEIRQKLLLPTRVTRVFNYNPASCLLPCIS